MHYIIVTVLKIYDIYKIYTNNKYISKCTDVYIISRHQRSAGKDKQGSYIVLYKYYIYIYIYVHYV